MRPLTFYKPPFRGLLPLVIAYFVFCFLVHPQATLTHDRFVDPDDVMYAMQSQELLDGQGWYDRFEHRMNPDSAATPTGTPFHYSRPMELPYAASMGLLTPLVGRPDALLYMAGFWPPFFLLCTILLLRKQARLFMPRRWANLAAFVTMTSQGLLFDFMLGRIDHHGTIAMLIEAALLCAILAITSSRHRARYAALAGGILAFDLSLGLEVLPWLLAITIYLGIWCSLRRERAILGVSYAAALVAVASLMLPTYRLDIFTLDGTAFSFLYIILLLGVFLCLGMVWLLRNIADPAKRMALGAIFAALAAVTFLASFPDLLQGPYGAVDQRLMDFILPNTKEAIPLLTRLPPATLLLCFMPFPLAGLIACLWQIRATRFHRRDAWILITLLHTTGIVLAVFYESRYVPYAQLFAIVPLTWTLYKLSRRAPAWKGALFAALPVLSAALPLIFYYNMPLVNGVLYPMMSYTPSCDISAAADALNAPPYDTGKPRLIINTGNQGPDILRKTRHAILAASYHENVTGNLNSLDFFRASTSDAAAAIVRKRHADLVLICDDVDRGYVIDPSHPDYALPHPFILSLIKHELPAWLEQIPLNSPSQIELFRVIPEQLP